MSADTVMLALLALALGLGGVRLLRGPGDADRVVALDLLSACVLAACALAAVLSGRVLYLDVALGFALVAFVGTLAWSRALERRADRAAERQEGRDECL